ncbi:MAG: hypothetical protein Q8O06_08150 [Acetobacterium sp.]|nr:hypothetical protein [Acetobacterium sp.]
MSEKPYHHGNLRNRLIEAGTHLSEAYFEKIQAPEKHCYIFEDSAHSPIFEEPDRSIAILKERQINF